jgi:hypothetical protein
MGRADRRTKQRVTSQWWEVLLTGLIVLGGFLAWLSHQLAASRDDATSIQVQVGLEWAQQKPPDYVAETLMALSVVNQTRREIRNVEAWPILNAVQLDHYSYQAISALQTRTWTRRPKEEERKQFPLSLSFHTEAVAEWTDHYRRRWRKSSDGTLSLVGWRSYRFMPKSSVDEQVDEREG